jgi:precorrin-2 dehydrogenase/sirohydrochlorin ferrochelatase
MAEPSQKFPEVQGGGSLIVAWQIRGKKVVVVGGGEVRSLIPIHSIYSLDRSLTPLTGEQVAAGRILHCLNADALVTVISPLSRLNPEVAHRVAQNQVTHIDRNFAGPSDLDGADMVLVAVDDPEASTTIWKMCKERRIPANIADVPPECDFYFGSVHRDGPLQIMVSTNGKGPRLASMIRKFIAKMLPSNAGEAIERIGELRVKLRQIAPRPEEGPKRMAWMTKVSDAYPWEAMCGLSEEDMGNLLKFYPSGKVPSLEELKGMRANPAVGTKEVFDGSFGFSVGA